MSNALSPSAELCIHLAPRSGAVMCVPGSWRHGRRHGILCTPETRAGARLLLELELTHHGMNSRIVATVYSTPGTCQIWHARFRKYAIIRGILLAQSSFPSPPSPSPPPLRNPDSGFGGKPVQTTWRVHGD